MTAHRTVREVIQEHFQQEVDFLRRLVQARSSNPFTPETSRPDHPVEAEVAALVHQELQCLGYRAELVGVSNERPNVLCHIRGNSGRQKTLILSTHMDTVEPPAGYRHDPWGAQIEQGRLYGAGAADAKAQIAAFIYAVRALHQAGVALAGNLTLAFVVDEESGACSPYGTHYLLEQGLLQGDAAIIGEPGDEKIASGHRGLYRFRLQVKGEAAHTGLKAWETGERGRNAILDVAHLAHALAGQPLPETPSAAFPGRRSVLTFPTLIKGGSGINVVPEACEAYGDARLLPGLSGSHIREIIQDRLDQLGIRTYQLDDLLDIPAVETNQSEDIVQHLARSIRDITGSFPRIGGSGPACDGWMFITRGIPTVCGYGVKSGSVHGVDEWVELASLQETTAIYAQTIQRHCGQYIALRW